MYYWSYRNSHIILSSEEELGLVQELGRNALERVSYHTSHKVRREIESRIFRYLKDSLKADPEAFHRRFVFRSFYNEEAQKMFPVLLDAYGRITRRTTIGFYGDILAGAYGSCHQAAVADSRSREQARMYVSRWSTAPFRESEENG